MENDKPGITASHGLIFSIIILLIGLACRSIIPGVPLSLANLIVIAAVSIMLGIFGGQATVKYRGATMGGVMAMTFILLNWVSADSTQISHFEISSESDLSEATISVSGDKTFYGAMIDRNYRFIVEGESVPKKNFDVFITFPKGADREQDLEYAFHNLPINYINSRLGSGEIAEWQFDPEPPGIGALTSEEGIAFKPRTQSQIQSDTTKHSFNVIASAYAGEDINKELTFDDQLIRLESGSDSVRRRARKEIALYGEDQVPRILEELSADSISYRKQLGLLNALSYIAQDTKDPSRLSAQFSDQDIERLVGSFQHKDPTMQQHAADLLLSLKDQRSIAPILDIAQASPDERQVKQALSIITANYDNLETDLKSSTDSGFQQIYTHSDSQQIKFALEHYLEKPVTFLSGEYIGQWSSSEYSNYGKITVNLSVEDQDNVEAKFSVTGGVVKGGKLKGKLIAVEPGVWKAELKDRRTSVTAIIKDGKIQGEYDARFYFFWTDSGWWDMTKAG